MPAPTPQLFDRLRALVAITDPNSRPCAELIEVFSGEPLTTIPVGTAVDVTSAVERARVAQRDWAARPVRERTAVIDQYLRLVSQRRELLMDIEQAETGKSRSAAQEDVIALLLTGRYYSRVAARLLAPRRVAGLLPGLTKTTVRRQPKGVVGVIAPWNYPMGLSIGDAVPALIAGNAVVLKPDSRTPYSALAATELLYEAGLPREVLAVVPGTGSVVGSAIVDQSDYLMFTGSAATGRRLTARCGERLIGFSAELGGKNPMIVTADANLDVAAKVTVRACFGNAGQLCISIERIYVDEAVATAFTAKFLDHLATLTVGPGYDWHHAMGSLASPEQVETVDTHVKDAIAKGATVLAGGKRRPDLGPYFYEPTVLSGVTDEMEVARTETFGPVVSIYPVSDVREAINRANDSDYGLNASVWADSDAAGAAIGAQLHSGMVNVGEGYGPAFASVAAPMGGMKHSGVGRRNGPEGLLKYTESQTVAIQRGLTLEPPPGIPDALWQRAFTPLVNALHFVRW